MSIKFDQYTNTLSVDDTTVTNADMTLVSEGTGSVNLNTANGIQLKVADTYGSVAAANYIKVQGRASGGPPFLTVDGSDTNPSLGLSSKGTGAVQLFTNSNATEQFRVSHTASAVNYLNATGGATGNSVIFSSQGSDSTIWINYQTKGSGTHQFLTNNGGAPQFLVSHTASTVNYVNVTGSATLTGGPTVSAQGSDFNIPLRLQSKGISAVELGNPAGWAGFTVTTTNNPNRIALNAPATGFIPTFTTAGVDTNAGMAFISKGTGAIDLAAGSSGVNISNGGTVTAITRTSAGSAYTTIPSVAISAPTTAGGVQATAVVGSMVTTGAAVVSGGTGYTLNDTITLVGGTNTGVAATFTVTGVSGGVVTSASPLNFGQYTVLPTNPVSVTGGTGSGATFNVNYGIGSAVGFNITNAGSGYVEQPTVTFSGGGGSGAAAYATVGSGVTLRSLASNLVFQTSAGIGFVINQATVQNANYISATGQAAGGAPALYAIGSDTNIAMNLSSKGSGGLNFITNTFGNQQFAVSHTASAVNYVQVTGAATGGSPTISSQGSDASPDLTYNAKGAGRHFFQSGGSSTFQINAGTGQVNRLRVQSSPANFGPILDAVGSDTNIPLVLQPKGTGALQAQQTDSTATGGNARGANAVDWQTSRGSANQVASNISSVVVGGYGNRAAGYASTVTGGFQNQAIGVEAFIGAGLTNQAQGDYSNVVSGKSNIAGGFFNFIGNGFTNSGTSNSSVTTQSATMNGTTAVTLSGSNASIKVGQYITGTSIAGDTYVAAVSGTSLTLSQAASGSSTSTLSFFTPHGVVVGGGNNQATGSYSFIGGGGDAGTAANRNVASGDWSTVGGGKKNTASGIGSVVAGGGTFAGGSDPNTASGAASVISGGASNNNSGFLGVIAGGYNNQSTATGTTVSGGFNNLASSQMGTVVGGSYGTTRGISGNTVFAANDASIASAYGISQAALLVLGVQTTDATATVLRSNTSAASTTNQVILPNNSAYYFSGSIVAGVTGAGNTSSWKFEGTIKRGANAASTTLVGTPVLNLINQDAGASTWVVALTADTTNGGLAVTVTGQASTTIRWVAKIETTEMTF